MSDRGDLRILLKLARQPGWFSELPDNIRKGVVAKLMGVLNKENPRPREIIGVARVMAQLEKMDLERAKLALQIVVEEDADQEDDGDQGPQT